MVISHDVVDRKNVIHSNIQKCTSVNYMHQSYRWVNFFVPDFNKFPNSLRSQADKKLLNCALFLTMRTNLKCTKKCFTIPGLSLFIRLSRDWIENQYWLNYWHILIIKGTSGFRSNTEIKP